MNPEDGAPRRGLRLGFGLAGLLAAAATYLAFDLGLMRGPVWRGAAVAIVIGISAAGIMLLLDRSMPGGKAGQKPVKPKGDWSCPQCGAAYVRQATECSDCHVPLVDTGGRGSPA